MTMIETMTVPNVAQEITLANGLPDLRGSSRVRRLTTSCAGPSRIIAAIGAPSRDRSGGLCRRRDAYRTASLVPPLVRLVAKAFLQALTLSHARHAAFVGQRVETAYELVCLDRASHDLFVTHEAMSPGEFKSAEEVSPSATAFIPAHSARHW